jgi:hypothetical protein
MKFVGTFCTYFHKEFHTAGCNISLDITIYTLGITIYTLGITIYTLDITIYTLHVTIYTYKFSHKVNNLHFKNRAYSSKIYHIKFQEFHNFKK